MDDDLPSECFGRTGFEKNGVVRNEYRHPSTNGECGRVQARTVVIYYVGVGPNRKEGAMPTRIPGEGRVIDDEHGWHGSVSNAARRPRCNRTNLQEVIRIRVACRG